MQIKNNTSMTTHEILESNDKNIKTTLNEWYKGIAQGIANMQLMMNFEAIIIGGGISESKLFDIEKIDSYIKEFMLDDFKNSYKLFKASKGNGAALIGMVKIIKDNLTNI